MKRYLIISVIIWIILLISVIYLFGIKKYSTDDRNLNQGTNGKMEVKSVFKQGEKIPVKYTAQGEDINPPLEISGIPSEALSLVLIVDDPDAPNGDWVHWVVFNIPSKTDKIDERDSPGIVGLNSWGRNEYGGPNPPSGIHRYFFKVYALDDELDLDKSSGKEDVLSAIEGHVVDSGELMGVYARE